MGKKKVTIQLSKNHGAPEATIFVDKTATLGTIQAALKSLYADRGALKSVGLKYCEGCRSGLDLIIKQHFEEQMMGG